jgi:phage gp29-like protein
MPNPVILYDAQGREIVPERALRSPGSGRAELAGVKETWCDSIATGLTPQRLAAVLRANDEGDNRDLQTLAIEMPERDLHYFSQLQTRRNKVSGAIRTAVPGDASAEAKRVAEEFQNLVMETPEFQWLIDDLMDAVDKGYSVNLPYWNTETTPWTFHRFEHWDCRLFTFDKETHRELRMRDSTREDGSVRLIPGQFIVHFPRVRTGVPLRAGIARLAAVTWFLKTHTVKDWKIFAEVFGMPLRIAHYDPLTATAAEKATLRHALMNLGHDAAAMLPRGMDIEFPDARRPTSGDNIYSGLCDYFDAQISKAILGQTMTSDDGSSMAQAKVHDGVRLDIARADALAVGATLTKLAQLWCYFNYPSVAAPKVVIDVSPPEDRKAFTDALLPWIEKTGMPVSVRWVRGKLGIPEPEEGEELIEVRPPEPAPGAAPAPGKPKPKGAPNSAGIEQTDDIIDDTLGEWEQVLTPHRTAVQAAADRAEGYDDFLKSLESIGSKIDSEPLVSAVAESGIEARGAGAD